MPEHNSGLSNLPQPWRQHPIAADGITSHASGVSVQPTAGRLRCCSLLDANGDMRGRAAWRTAKSGRTASSPTAIFNTSTLHPAAGKKRRRGLGAMRRAEMLASWLAAIEFVHSVLMESLGVLVLSVLWFLGVFYDLRCRCNDWSKRTKVNHYFKTAPWHFLIVNCYVVLSSSLSYCITKGTTKIALILC